MRNLKKILALVLALVMSLSLMSVASAAETTTTDAASAYKTAVDVFKGLGVVRGDDQGIRENEPIIRAEAAALIYRVHTADVTDNQADLHTASTFNDLAPVEAWAKGYISYCHNRQIIKGDGDGKFRPLENITGYEVLAMTLRALGYGQAGEYQGSEWYLRTASDAQTMGLLKGVSAVDQTPERLSQPASRGLVFQIMFNAVLMDQVAYSAYTPNGYSSLGNSMADKLGLEDVTGVVIANEWANLEGNKPLAEGKTTLKVEGKNRTINVSTAGAEIGTSVHAYLKGETVLTDVEDAGNDIKNNEGAKTTVKDLRGSIAVDDDTEYFVNYSEVTKEYSDWRLEYVVVLNRTEADIAQLVYDNGGVAFIDDDGDLVLDNNATEQNTCIYPTNATNSKSAEWLKDHSTDTTKRDYTYNKSIRAGVKLTATDLYYMEEIFRGSDSFNDSAYQGHDVMNGEVYAATKSGSDNTNRSYDVSDDLNWNQFCEKYLDLNANDSIAGANNGESLRVIDNNGDGVADYVLKVEFVMTTIVDYDKRTDSYFVEYDADETEGKDSPIKASAIKGIDGAEVDLSTDAVVLYTLIDGVYYTMNPEVATMTIDKKGIDTKNDTYTVDGEDHVWSGIFKEAKHYYQQLKELAEGVSYDFHLDYFGYTRLANEHVKNFVLLTDGYYWSNRRDSETKAQIYDDSQEKLVDVDVNDYNPKNINPNGYFIYQYANADSIDDAWKRLNAFGTTYWLKDEAADGTDYIHYNRYASASSSEVVTKDPFKTNIAAYTEEDGVYNLYSVSDIDTNFLHRNRPYNTYEIAGTKQGTAFSDSEITVKTGSVSAMDTALYGITEWADETTIADVRRIMTTGTTTYYYVTWDSKGEAEVTSWVGYSNAPESLGDFVAQKAYTVAYTSDSNADYDVAEVVVFEGKFDAPVYNAWLTYAARGDNRFNEYEYSLGIDPDGEEGYGDWLTRLGVFYKDTVKSLELDGDHSDKLLKFWTLDSSNNAVPAPIAGKHYEDYGIYYGTINTRQNVNWRDYITFGEGKAVYDVLKSDDMVEYRFVFDTTKTDSEIYAVDADPDTRLMDTNEVIYMLNGKGEIALVVNLSDSVDQRGNHIDLDEIDALVALRDSVKNDQNAVKNSDLTFSGATVKGVAVKDGKVTISNKASTDVATAGLEFTSNADSVTVYFKNDKKTVTEKNNVWTEEKGAVAAGTYQIILEKAGCDPVTKTIEVTVADKSTDATIKSLTIKGVSVDLTKTTGSGAAITLTDPVVVSAAQNATDALQIEVVLNDANADYAVTDAKSSGIAKGNNKGALTKGSYSDITITVTPESGSSGNVVYTISSLTVGKYDLSVAAPEIKDPTGTDSTKATVSLKTGALIPDDENLTFTVTPDEGYEIVSVKYTTTSGSKTGTFGPSADDEYTVPKADLAGQTTITITVVVKKTVTPADELKAAKSGANDHVDALADAARTAVESDPDADTLTERIGELRIAAKEAIGKAGSIAEVKAAVTEFDESISALSSNLEVVTPDEAEPAPEGVKPIDPEVVAPVVAGTMTTVIDSTAGSGSEVAYISGTLDSENVFVKGQVLTEAQAKALCMWWLGEDDPSEAQMKSVLDNIFADSAYNGSTYFAIVEAVAEDGLVYLVGVGDQTNKTWADFSGVVFPNT